MPYNKSDNSSNYNKEERGGWYCTNPKKHHEQLQHHGADEPHNHHAERNDQQTQRQPEAKQQRTADHRTDNTAGKPKHKNPYDIPDWSKPQEPTPAKKTNKSCLGCILFILLSPLLISIIAVLVIDDNIDPASDDEMYEEYIDSDDSYEIESAEVVDEEDVVPVDTVDLDYQ